MSSSKLRKISKIVKEISMQSSQSVYDISGLDLSLCKFYYRTPQELFKDLPSGDYTINKSSNQQSLVIQNNEVISSGEAIQVCYEMDLSSSKYEVDFEVDINRLTTSYNELVEDVHTLWEYIRKTGMIADDTTIDLILPQLNNNEVWVKSEDGYKGMPLDDVEQSIKDIIDKYSQQKIEEIKREVTTHVDSEIQRATNEITDVKDTSIQNIKDQEKTSTNNMISEINKHTEKKKVELNDHEQLKEQELNDLHQQLSARLQELIDGAVMDKGVLPINSDWHLLDRGNYYVIDLFNSNYKNHPINIVNQNEGQGIVMVGIADDGKTKIIRYYSTSKRMFFQVLTQSNIWSEWAILSGGNGTVYEIVQNNHGFNFNAVSLDGLTNRWIIADKNTGADAVAIKIDDNRFQLLFNGQGIIPTSSRDDKGHEFIYDEYYFLSNTVNGAFQKDKPTYGLFQPLFHTRMVENKLVADVQIGDIHDLTQHIVDSETIKEFGIATEKDLLNKLDKGNVSSNYDTAEKIEYQIKKLQANTIEDLIAMNFLKVGDIVEVLGYYSAGDGADHKRIISASDDGSGVQLNNGLWANIVHNGEVNVSWFGCKKDDESFSVKNSELVNNQLKNKNTHLFFPKGTWSFNQIKFNSFCSLKGEGEEVTFLKQVGEITNVGQSIFKNHSFLQAIEDKNGVFNANAFSVISNMTIKGIKQSNINGIGFSGTESNVENKSEWNDQHTLIENVEVREFYNGIYFGEYYKENRIDKVISRYNSNTGIIYKGTDYFISNTTCHSNDINGFELIGGESRLEFSKAFYNKKVGLVLSGTANVNNFSSQENFETGIKIIRNNQAHNLTNLFIGSNGISGGSPSHIKENSSGIEISANGCYIFLTLNTNDFRGIQDGLDMSYSYNLIKFTGKYNSVVGNVNSQIGFKEFFDLKNNFLKVTFNGQDLSKSWTQSEWDYNDGDEMIVGYGYIEDVPNERYVGIFGNWELINPFVDQNKVKEKNNFKMRIQRFTSKYVQAKISHNDINERWKNKIKIYKKEVSGGAKILMTYTVSASYNTVHFNGNCYDASFYFYPQVYRDKFINDGSYEDVEIIDTTPSVPISQLNTPYMATKMQQEGVYNDFISYMDEKTAYDKQQRKLSEERQLIYNEALKENPELTFEEFMSVQPMMLNLIEEPQPSEALQKFMDKYL